MFLRLSISLECMKVFPSLFLCAETWNQKPQTQTNTPLLLGFFKVVGQQVCHYRSRALGVSDSENQACKTSVVHWQSLCVCLPLLPTSCTTTKGFLNHNGKSEYCTTNSRTRPGTTATLLQLSTHEEHIKTLHSKMVCKHGGWCRWTCFSSL